MVAFTLHLILWIVCVLFRIFVICWVCYGIYALIKNKREWWLVDKHQKEREKKEREEQWKRVSKELKESWFSLESKEKKMTPKEKAEYEKKMAKLKKDKIIIMIAFGIVAILILFWMIVSMSE